MEFLLILVASILSAVIFDLMSIMKKVNEMIGISKRSLEVMKSPDLDDDTQQKLLLSISGKVFLSSIKLSVSLVVITLPFLAIHVTEILTMRTASFAESLGTLTGIGLSLLGFLSYFGAKQIYARFGL
jgi:hypothetical protein